MTLAELRPLNDTPDAIRSALTAMEREIASTRDRVEVLRLKRRDLLLDGTVRDIQQVDAEVSKLEIWIEQVSDLQTLVEPTLSVARGRMIVADLQVKVATAMKAAVIFDGWLTEQYPALFGALQEGLRLNQAATSLEAEAHRALLGVIGSADLRAFGGLPADLFTSFPDSLGYLSGRLDVPAPFRSTATSKDTGLNDAL